MNALKINLGSGQRKFGQGGVGGWVNVDCQARWEPDVLCDASAMPFDDGSAEIIVAHHVIEHVGLGEFDTVIRECHRVLAVGGSLIITCPDIFALAKALIRGMTPAGDRFGEYLFCVNMYGAYMGNEADRHRWGYSEFTLAQSLDTIVEWHRVKGFDWRAIEGASIARDFWILGVEAVK